MKKILIALSIVLVSVIAYTSFAGVTPPAAVLKGFSEKFPKATEVKWGMETKTEYEADFKVDGKSMSANFKDDGTWVVTESAVAQKDLPGGIMEYINKNIPGAVIKETAKLEMPGGKVNYEVEIKGDDYIFDETGKFIKSGEED